MFFRYALQQIPALFCVCFQGAKGRQKKSRATYRETRCATHFSNKNLFTKGGLKKNASTPKIKQGCGSANETVGQLAAPPLFNRRSPTSLKGARTSEAMIHAPCIECLKCLENAAIKAFVPSVPCVPTYRERRRCTASVLSPVSPLFYDHRFRRPQRHRAKPIPLRRGR